MYGISNSYQFVCLMKALGVGFLFGSVWFTFRLIRLKFNSPAAVFFQDILFCQICTFASFLFMMDINHGMVRTYVILAEAVGFALFHFTVGGLMRPKKRKTNEKK